jgi:hypothetical protein
MMDEPDELRSLRAVVARVAAAHRVQPYEAIWPLGFELLDDLENFGYHCSPVNSLAFGATGGDGVHLSLLDGPPSPGAIVVTTPTADNPNSVIAESFADFLRLGYHGGFGWLEELGHSREDLQAKYTAKPGGLSAAARDLLGEIRSTFNLLPYEDVAAHLAALEEHTAHLLLPDQEEWQRRHGV